MGPQKLFSNNEVAVNRVMQRVLRAFEFIEERKPIGFDTIFAVTLALECQLTPDDSISTTPSISWFPVDLLRRRCVFPVSNVLLYRFNF